VFEKTFTPAMYVGEGQWMQEKGYSAAATAAGDETKTSWWW
jgi:hypothetical protein